ncbi:zinc-binding dehydrogenase [Streptomyces abikoensis]|uniref:zinc-binding dehydrogenase n=1 Tax=Streptomyces abikoensis TaxID=97398 RepID=UPI0033D72122
MGFGAVAIAHGPEKAGFAKRLGAHHYVDSTPGTPVGESLRALGGARVVLATAGNSEAGTAIVEGLAPRGELAGSWWSSGRTPRRWASNPAQLLSDARVLRATARAPRGTWRTAWRSASCTASAR